MLFKKNQRTLKGPIFKFCEIRMYHLGSVLKLIQNLSNNMSSNDIQQVISNMGKMSSLLTTFTRTHNKETLAGLRFFGLFGILLVFGSLFLVLLVLVTCCFVICLFFILFFFAQIFAFILFRISVLNLK